MAVRRLLAALVLASVLAGCSDDDPTPAPNPSPTTSPASASESPSASPSAEAETPEAFIRRWAAVDAEMQNTGDTTTYRQMTRGCADCTEFADRIENIYKAGGFVETDGWAIRSIEQRGPRNTPVVTFVAAAAPSRYAESKGAPVQQLEGGETTYRVELIRRGGDWQVKRWWQVAE